MSAAPGPSKLPPEKLATLRRTMDSKVTLAVVRRCGNGSSMSLLGLHSAIHEGIDGGE